MTIDTQARQSAKLRELKEALVTARILTLSEQAKILGLYRSTTWNILQGNYKSSGLSATIINRILAAPQLPPIVRAKILEYVEEKVSGRYGHSKEQRHKFFDQLSVNQVEQARLKDRLYLQPDARVAHRGRLLLPPDQNT